jgi:hypothetical protein
MTVGSPLRPADFARWTPGVTSRISGLVDAA